jgi:glutaryl-CoA dehydrogenase
MTIEYSDFLGAFQNLSETEELTVSTIRKFVHEKFQPHIKEYFEKGFFPRELIQEIARLGILGCQLSGYGCAGLDSLSYGLMMKELERGDSGLRSFASVQSSLVMFAIHAFGSEDQKQHFLPQMAQGKIVGCFGLTEPDFGSNPAGMRTFAKKDGKNWILNGSKTWITNAPIADLAVVWAQSDNGICGFLVEKGTKGFHTQEIHDKLSLRASATGSLFFNQCKIPESSRLEKTHDLKHALMCLNQARFGIAFGVLGAAEDCLREALAYTKERLVFHKPLASFQLVQRKLALMATEIAKGNLVARQLAVLKDSKRLLPAQVSMAKQNNVHIALECARTTRDLLGANGISAEYHCMRHMCNLESVSTYEGTNDIHLLIVGQELTGIGAFD